MRALSFILVAGVLSLIGPNRAFADLSITLTPATQTPTPGADAVFTGTLTNTGSSDIALNDVSLSFNPPAATYLTGDRNFFFATVPGILSAGEIYTGPIFKLSVATRPAGSYTGSITMQGGTDLFTFGNLASANFTVQGGNQTPTADSITPNAGSGSTQLFQAIYSDASGSAAIASTYLLFNNTLAADNACLVLYYQPTNSLYLYNDSASAVLGPLTPGVAGAQQNSQCTLDGGASSVVVSSTSLTVKTALTFKPAFSGSKTEYLYVADSINLNSGWQIRGTWTPFTASPPTADSITPNAGSGSTQLFQSVYSDPGGSSAITSTYLLFNNTLSASNACLVLYYRPGNSLYLFNDAGTALLGPLTPGAAGTQQNSQCILDGAVSSVVVSSTSLTVKTALTFKATFTGLKTDYLYVADANNLSSGWQVRGTWTPFVAVSPTADSVTPNSGSGSLQLFQAVYSDTSGSSAITYTYLLFANTLSAANACMVLYNQPTNSLYLFNDAGTALLGPLTPGVAGTQQNSQCMLDGSTSSIVLSSTSLTVKAALTFKPTFTGAKTEFLYVADSNNLNSGWQIRGTWTPFPASAPTADSISPNSGSGSTQLFQSVYSDTGGSSAIVSTYLLFNNTLVAANGCFLLYNQQSNSLYLFDDAGATALGPLTPGVAGTQQNSQCILEAGASSIVTSANSVTVKTALTFKPAFTGSKFEYLYVADSNNLNSNWQTLGTWTVP